MSGGAIDDADRLVFYQTHGLAGGVIGQAEKNDIRFVKQLFPSSGVLTLIVGYPENFNVIPAIQPLAYLKAGGAVLSVNKHRFLHDLLILFRVRTDVKYN